jgi:calcineurin-like phosphoesterase family protein
MIKWFLFSLNGKIYHVMGNHDEKINKIKRYDRFEDIYEYGTEIWVRDDDNEEAKRSSGKQQIILSHYPIMSWDRRRYGSWHLHGHSHQQLTTDPNFDWYYKQKVFDVGCNGIDYTPISYKKIKDIMSKKIIIKGRG